MIPLPWAIPGTKVICIRDRPWKNIRGGSPPPDLKVPLFMREYTIRTVGVMTHGGIGLTFNELPNRIYPRSRREPLFAARFFRPVLSLPEEVSSTQKETA